MLFKQFQDKPLEFIQKYLRLVPEPYQAQVYKEVGERKGRFGLTHRDSHLLLEIVCALALWRGICCAVPSQIITVRENCADQWHEVTGLLLKEAVPLIQQQVRYNGDHRCYLAYGVVPILVAVEWPDSLHEYPDGSDIYFGDFEATPTQVIDDAGKMARDDCLLVLPVYQCH